MKIAMSVAAGLAVFVLSASADRMDEEPPAPVYLSELEELSQAICESELEWIFLPVTNELTEGERVYALLVKNNPPPVSPPILTEAERTWLISQPCKEGRMSARFVVS